MPLITLQIVQHLHLGGIEKLVIDFLKFKTKNHQLFIVALEGSKQASLSHWPELKRYQTSLIFLNKPKKFDIQAIKKLRAIIHQHRIQAIYTHHIGPLLYGTLANLGLGRQHIHIEHDAWHLKKTKNRFITNIALRKKTRLVADACAVATDLSKCLHHPINHIITNGINTEYFRKGDPHQARRVLKLPTQYTLIGCAGRLVKEKGLSNVIQALSELSDHIHLVLAGTGQEKKHLTNLINKLHLTHRIHWLGHCEQMIYFYQALDLYILASHHEGLPLALLEAQACECTIIATNVGAINEVLSPSHGYLIEPNNVPILINTIKHALKQPKPLVLTVEEKKRIDIRHTVHCYEALL